MMETSERNQRIVEILARNAPAIGLASEESGEAFGVPGLDERLPARGLPKGAVSEILSSQGGLATGGLSLLMPLMARLTQAEGRVVIIDPPAEVNPVALAAAGVDLAYLVLLRPKSQRDALWATDLCAKNKAVALTLSGLDRLRELDIRHLQLSAEKSGSCTVLLRPSNAAASASAALRMRVSPVARAAKQIRIEFLRTRGAFPPAPMILEIDDHGQALDVRVCPTSALPAIAATQASASA